MILKTVLRWLWVALAFLVSCWVALVVLFVFGVWWMGGEIRDAAPGDVFIWHTADVFAAVFFTTAVAPALTALPALVAVIVAEIFHIRSWIYYTALGGAALAAVPLLAAEGPNAATVPAADYMTIFASAGFAGGLAYWALAGARA